MGENTLATKDKKPETKKDAKTKKVTNPLSPAGRYFSGAWYELKQVRWPNRKSTWGLTAAVLGFTAFFVLLVLLLDALFKYLFEIILG